MNLKTLIPVVAVAFAAAMPLDAVYGAPPPPPPGVHLRPGMMWCDHCGGSGTHGRTWYGWRKTCRKCGGSGMMPRPLPPPPPPPPPKPHHAVRPPAPGPAHPPHHAAPAPTPGRPQPPRPHDARRDPPRR